MAKSYLDKNGLSHFWGKIKSYVKFRNLSPEQTKTYTGVIATANNDTDGSLYFGRIIPDDYHVPWRIRYRMDVQIAGLSSDTDRNSMYDVELKGLNNTYYGYKNDNLCNTTYRGIYSHLLYPCTNAGINAGLGHLVGVRLYYAYKPATAANSRTFVIKIMETENCSFEFFDSFIVYANAPGTGSTNYYTRCILDGSSNGYKIYGDADQPNYQVRYYYACRKAHAALYRYQICLTRRDHDLLPVNSVNNSTAANKTLTKDSFDPFGEIFYWDYTGTVAAGGNVTDGYLKSHVVADLRYSFNISTSIGLVARKPLYLMAVMSQDETATLVGNTPLTQTLPTSADGYIYIYLGMVCADSSPYRIDLALDHPVYAFKGNRVTLINSYSDFVSDSSGGTEYIGAFPIGVTDNTISHAESGVIDGSYGPSADQTPGFGSTFPVPYATVDAKGHVTAMTSHTVKIPNTAATTSAAGLMSSADKTKMNAIGDVAGAVNGATSIANKSVPGNSDVTNLGSFTLPAGLWIVRVHVRWNSNADGNRTINISLTSGGDALSVWNTMKVPASPTSYTHMSLVTFLEQDTSKTYYLNAQQNSGKAITAAVRWGAIRIA